MYQGFNRENRVFIFLFFLPLFWRPLEQNIIWEVVSPCGAKLSPSGSCSAGLSTHCAGPPALLFIFCLWHGKQSPNSWAFSLSSVLLLSAMPGNPMQTNSFPTSILHAVPLAADDLLNQSLWFSSISGSNVVHPTRHAANALPQTAPFLLRSASTKKLGATSSACPCFAGDRIF